MELHGILSKVVLPNEESHKGENGRVLVIGGSKLFHASVFWSADVASRIVDLVHFTSPAEENNDLVRAKMKEKFWSGIVVLWKDVNSYIEEDDCILIGPGMPREEGLQKEERKTGDIVNDLISRYPEKRWVLDGGALQEMDGNLLNDKMIVTPHAGEFLQLFGEEVEENIQARCVQVERAVKKCNGVTILLKGKVDVVGWSGGIEVIEGGNSGMTKGGTGDVLAGLVAALYAKSDAWVSAAAASYVAKNAGDAVFAEKGVFYNASDLVEMIPIVLAKEIMNK